MNAYRRIRESLSGITSFISESIGGIKILKAFTQEKSFYSRFFNINSSHKKTVIKQAKIWNTYFPVINILYIISVILVMFFGGRFVLNNSLTVGTLIAFLLLLGMLFWPIRELGILYNILLSSAAATERIFLFLDTKPDIVNSPQSFDLKEVGGSIKMKDIYFKYDSKSDWILKDINLHSKPDSTIALVGPTGSGKSSIINLLIRFYDPQKGSIMIDQFNIKDITIKSLREKIGIVLQENFLFTGTVMYNLKYGNPSISDNNVIKLAKKLGSHKIIQNLSRGYFTQVKERGEGISQGERQLICLTRIFVADPKIVILDEATSSVDTNTELIIQNAMKEILRNRTTFIAAHRLSTIRNADHILMIDKGKIIESGDFHALIKKNGKFAKLYHYYKQ